jgi:hypothetical protein
VFQASDLAGAKRREFLGAAREGGALLRDTDGFALTMVPLAQLEAVTEIAQAAVAALLALAALGRGSTRPADLGQLAWLAAFEVAPQGGWLPSAVTTVVKVTIP